MRKNNIENRNNLKKHGKESVKEWVHLKSKQNLHMYNQTKLYRRQKRKASTDTE